jgi:hypothetical protein
MAGLPLLPQGFMESLPERQGEFVHLTVPVKGDGLANVVDHHLARVAADHVRLELGTERGVDRAIDVVVQQRKQVFALHHELFMLMWTLHAAKSYGDWTRQIVVWVGWL